MPYPGESASLLTSLCYVVSTVVFARAARRVGASTVNGVRLGAALLVMVILHQVLLGSPFPAGAGPARLAWLGLSGLIGFALGDALLFEAYVQLGPRLTLLVYTLWPVLSALMAWAFLGEAMGLRRTAAMLVTVAGIALVVAEPGRTAGAAAPGRPRRLSLGLMLALGASAGQAVGFIFAKVGMAGGYSPVSANTVRVAAGAASLWAWQGLRRELAPTWPGSGTAGPRPRSSWAPCSGRCPGWC